MILVDGVVSCLASLLLMVVSTYHSACSAWSGVMTLMYVRSCLLLRLVISYLVEGSLTDHCVIGD